MGARDETLIFFHIEHLINNPIELYPRTYRKHLKIKNEKLYQF
jgi:hypothetical protein